jgi:hypothetical protein
MRDDAINDGILMADTNVKFCTACGRKVDLDAHFCAWCDADLRANEEHNVQQDAVTGEAVVGWASGVVIGDKWGYGTRMLLFTTDRMVVAYANEHAYKVAQYKDEIDQHEWQAERMAFGRETGKMLSKNIPYQELHSHPVFRSRQIVDDLVSANKKNYAIPYSEITQLRVKLPTVSHRGLVTLTTAEGENVFRIVQKAIPLKIVSSSTQASPYFNPYPGDWEFLKSPPPELEGKLVIDGPLNYVK